MSETNLIQCDLEIDLDTHNLVGIKDKETGRWLWKRQWDDVLFEKCTKPRLPLSCGQLGAETEEKRSRGEEGRKVADEVIMYQTSSPFPLPGPNSTPELHYVELKKKRVH